MRCEICDTEIPAGATECPHCGFEVAWMRGNMEYSDSVYAEEYEQDRGYRIRSGPVQTRSGKRELRQRISEEYIDQQPDRKERKNHSLIVPVLVAMVVGVLISSTVFYLYLRARKEEVQLPGVVALDSGLAVSQPFDPVFTETPLEEVYKYDKDGFIGISVPLTLEMGTDSIEAIQIDGQTAEGMTRKFENVKWFGKYLGNLYTLDSNDNINERRAIEFIFSENVDCAEIVDLLSCQLGAPRHSENYNDKRYATANIMWYIENEKYCYTLKYMTRTGETSIILQRVDPSILTTHRQCQDAIKADSVLDAAYNSIMDRRKYIDLSIETVISEKGAVFDRTTDDSIYFIEPAELFGFSGYYSYSLENPERDSWYSDFVGQVQSVTFYFNDLSEDDKDAILDYLYRMYGENEDSDQYYDGEWNSYYAACSVKVKNTDTPSIFFSHPAMDYYKYDPDCNNSTSTENIPELIDCDSSILHLEDASHSLVLSYFDDSFDVCWKLAKDAVLKELKSPSSAVFATASYKTNDVRIERDGNSYMVTSWVDAQNSFGAQIRTDFRVLISRNGESFSVEHVFFEGQN